MKVLIITTGYTGYAVLVPDHYDSNDQDTDDWMHELFEDGVPLNDTRIGSKVFTVIDEAELERREPGWFERKRNRKEEDR